MNEIVEECVKFGPREHLGGVFTQAIGASGLVLVNAGLVPRFGPFRLYAEIARGLARIGVSTLRFDLGGIGNSVMNQSHLPLKIRTQQEIRSAVDLLTARYFFQNIAVGGLCSGAEDAFRYAETDVRVTDVILMDPFGFRTNGFWWRHAIHRAKRRLMRALGLYRAFTRKSDSALIAYKTMDPDEATRILTSLIHRKVRVHFIYTAGMIESYNYRSQLKDMFPGVDFKNLVTIDHFPQMDHTQVFKEDRDQLCLSFERHFA